MGDRVNTLKLAIRYAEVLPFDVYKAKLNHQAVHGKDNVVLANFTIQRAELKSNVEQKAHIGNRNSIMNN